MAEVIKPIIKVDIGDSQKTVKSLKEDISKLRDTILNLEEGTDDYVSAVNQLTQSQRELDNVMALTKKTATALDGSYDALTHKMALLKKEWRATNDEARRNELGKQIDAINDQLKEFDGSIGNFQRNVGNYANSFKEAFDQQQQATQNVRIGLDGLQKTASGLANGYAAVQGAMNLLNIENTEFEKAMIKVQSAMAIAQGIGGMKDLIEGAGTLKVAFKGAVTGVKTFITSLKGMKAAIIGTGIGILIVLIGTLVANWDKISKLWSNDRPQDIAARAIEKLNRVMEQQAERTVVKSTEALKQYTIALQEAKGDVDKIREATEEYNKTLDELSLKEAKDNLKALQEAEKETYEAYLKLNNKKRKDSENEVVKAYLETKEKRINAEKEVASIVNKFELDKQNKIADEKRLRAEAHKQRMEQIKTERDELKKTYANLSNNLLTLELSEFNQAYTALVVQYTEDEKLLQKSLNNKLISQQEYNHQRWLLQKQLGEAISKLFEEQDKNDAEKLYESHQAKLQQIEAAYKVASGKLAIETSSVPDVVGSIFDLGSGDDARAMEELLAQENEYYETSYQKEQEFLQQKLELNQTYLSAITDADKRIEQEQIIAEIELEIEQSKFNEKERLRALDYQKEKQKQDNTKKLFNASLQATSSLLSGIADAYESDEKNAEKNADKIKGLRIAAATIDTIQGAVAAYTTTVRDVGGIPGMVLGAINSAAIVAMGIANINKIKNTDATGKSNASISSVSPATSTYSNELPVTYTRNVTSASEIDRLNQDSRVYILESDIQASNKRVAVRQSESSF